MKTTTIAVLGAASALALALPASVPAAAQGMQMDTGPMQMMGGAAPADVPRVPPVAGYSEGEPVFFIHTEVSDPQIGETLTTMMGSPVPIVPALADASDEMLASVYVFTNGMEPDGPRGPLGYQPDVFDRPVGVDGYSPLRELVLTTWSETAEPPVLTSAGDIEAAIEAGELTTERPGVVANMPLLTWPGGQR